MDLKNNIFGKIDFFSKTYTFTFGGKEKFKSKIGGYFTIFTIFGVFYCIWLLGKEIIYRNRPKDYQVISINDQPQNLTLKVPTAFMIQDNRGNIFKEYDRYFTFEAYYWHNYRVNDTFQNVVPPKKLNMRKCVKTDFSEELLPTFMNLKMESALCLEEPEQKLGGDFNIDFAKFISVRITPCYNTTERDSCLPKEKIFSFLNLKNLVVSLKSEKITYDSRDYIKPVNKIIGEDNILIDPYIFNFPKYQMYQFHVNTDSGIIGSDYSIESFYEFTFLNDIITAFDNNGVLPEDFKQLILYEYTFFESPVVKTQHRSYLKLTEVLASVGGLLKIYMLCLNFLFHAIYRRIMYEKIITRIFNFDNVNSVKARNKNPNYFNNFFEIDNIPGSVSPLNKKNNIHSPIKNDKVLEENSQKELKNFKIFDESQKVLKNDNTIPCNQENFLKKYENSSFQNQIIIKAKGSLKTINNKTPVTLFNNSKITKNRDSQISNFFAINTLLAKRKFNSIYQKPIFSVMDHIRLSYFPFCVSCFTKLNTTNIKFESLMEYVFSYIDVLNMINKFYELEKIKFILFNKKQLAIFENIGIPKDPYNFTANTCRKINNLYYFQHDFAAQKKKIEEFFGPHYEKSSKKNQRLKKLYLEQ